MLKRHEIQVLRRAGHAQIDVAKLASVSLGSVRRVECEPDVTPSIWRTNASSETLVDPRKPSLFGPWSWSC